MKTDRTVKVLLGMIALALWMIVLNPWLHPAAVMAQSKGLNDPAFQSLLQLQNIEGWVHFLLGPAGDIRADLRSIADGTCKNKKICDGPLGLLAPGVLRKQEDQQYYPADFGRLIQMCESSEGVDRSFCSAYIAGFADAVTAIQPVLGRWVACVAGVDRGAIQSGILKYAKAHPETLHSADRDLQVLSALQSAYGCSRPGESQ